MGFRGSCGISASTVPLLCFTGSSRKGFRVLVPFMGMPSGDRRKRGKPLQSPGSPQGCIILV